MARLSQTQLHPLMQATNFLRSGETPLCVVQVGAADSQARMRQEVLRGLSDSRQPWLSPTYFYDARGSKLYEAITRLPEYYPTRTEAALLKATAPELRKLVAPQEVVELGSGSSTKTRLLLDALGAQQRRLVYIPIDVSSTMLEASAGQLVADYPQLRVLGLAGTYEEAFRALPPATDRLFIFLGGTIGNFPDAYQSSFFAHLGALMRPGSRLLLGFDRRPQASKPIEVVEAAYNDSQGMTAEFNLNMLTHLNTALGCDFAPSAWAHQAVYNEVEHQIEMYLVSLLDQVVTFPDHDRPFEFKQGEKILTELSRKFDPDELTQWFEARNFRCNRQWTDAQGHVGLMLLERTPTR